MAMIPYMAAGYAVDRMMGGSGMTGLALGTGAGALGTGAFSGFFGAPEVASSTGFQLGSSAAGSLQPTLGTLTTQFPTTYGLDLTAGLTPVDLGASDALLGSYVDPTLSQFALPTSTPVYTNALNAPLGEFGLSGPLQTQAFAEKGLMDYITPTTDFINKSWEDMSLADKGSTLMMGSQAVDTMTAPQNMIQPPQPRVEQGKEPNIAAPLAINVPASGVQIATSGQLERMLTPQQKRALGLL